MPPGGPALARKEAEHDLLDPAPETEGELS